MKRSNLRRYTTLKRTGSLRSRSAKKVREVKAVGVERQDFKREFPICMRCHAEPATDVHEITRGSFRPRGYGDRRAWLSLGRKCHDDCGNYSVVPLTEQYRIKLENDPEFFDRVWLNTTRGRAPESITMEEVCQSKSATA